MRPRHLVVLAAAALSACVGKGLPTDTTIEATFPSASPSTSLPRQLRMATFNVHREPGDVVARGVKNDRALRDLDLLVLQEVHRVERPGAASCSAACSLGKDLGFYSLYAPGHRQGDGTDGVAILSRSPILSGQVMELPFFDVTFNSGRRIALIATLLVDGAPVTVYAVHLDNRLTTGQRRLQMRPVLEHARRQKTPVIIAGDVNTMPFTWAGGVIPMPTPRQDDALEALARAHGFDTPVTDSGPTFRYLGMKLDAIYTRGFATHRFATAEAQSVSDHLALWAVLEARGARPVAAPPHVAASARRAVPRTSAVMAK